MAERPNFTETPIQASKDVLDRAQALAERGIAQVVVEAVDHLPDFGKNILAGLRLCENDRINQIIEDPEARQAALKQE